MNNSINHIIFTDVYQQEIVSECRIDIHFTVDPQDYFIEVYKVDGVYRPSSIWHYGGHHCSFCRRERLSGQCDSLLNQLNELYQAVIEHPSIRLKWLYIPHE